MFGKIEDLNMMKDELGGGMGICWIRFVGEDLSPDYVFSFDGGLVSGGKEREREREKERGQRSAREAVLRCHNHKVIFGAGAGGGQSRVLKVELDGDGEGCKKAVRAEMERRREERKEKRREKEFISRESLTLTATAMAPPPTERERERPLHPSLPPKPTQALSSTSPSASSPSSSGSGSGSTSSIATQQRPYHTSLPSRLQSTPYHPSPLRSSTIAERAEREGWDTWIAEPSPEGTPSHSHSHSRSRSRSRESRSPSPYYHHHHRHHTHTHTQRGRDRDRDIYRPSRSHSEDSDKERDEAVQRELAKNGHEHVRLRVGGEGYDRRGRIGESDVRRYFEEGGFLIDKVLFSFFRLSLEFFDEFCGGGKVLHDSQAWYITFPSSGIARRTLVVLGATPLLHHSINLSALPAPSLKGKERPSRNSGPWTDEDIVTQAREMIVSQLRDVAEKDVKERVGKTHVWSVVDEWSSSSRGGQKTGLLGIGTTNGVAVVEAKKDGLKGLSFKKREGVVKKRVLEEDVVSVKEDEMEGEEEDQPKTKRRRIVKKGDLPVEDVDLESQSEEPTRTPTPVLEVASPERPLKRPLEDEVEQVPQKKKRKKTVVKKDVLSVPKVKGLPVVDIVMSDDGTASPEPSPPPPTTRKPPKPKPVKKPKPPPKQRSPTPDPFLLGLVEEGNEDEELYLLKVGVLRRKGLVPPSPPAPPHWPPIPAPPDEEAEEEEGQKGPPPLRIHATGSARTEGYYKIPEASKVLYQPERNRTRTIMPTTTTDDPSSGLSTVSAPAAASSRENRADSRRLASRMEQTNKYIQHMHANSTSEDKEATLLKVKFNQLRARKKQLKFARSPIHDWGLYAMEYIPAGDMVIEYVGEIIRASVADRKEVFYENAGIGSSYLFRIDEEDVVDATKKGNLGYVF
jgi:hypothetical protein